VILAERLVNEIEESIGRVKEPYRSRLQAWIEGHVPSMNSGRSLSSAEGLHPELAEGQIGKPVQGDNLSHWLQGFDAISMIDQYQLLQIVCDEAARIFGDNGSEKGKHLDEIET